MPRATVTGHPGQLTRVLCRPIGGCRDSRSAVEQVEAEDDAALARIVHDLSQCTWPIDGLQTDHDGMRRWVEVVQVSERPQVADTTV